MQVQGRCKATWTREFKLPWREAGPPNHHDDNVRVGGVQRGDGRGRLRAAGLHPGGLGVVVEGG